eukprot:scaffold21638_cov22-Prasinocladus_malaysianus.AAC.1
MPNRWINYKTKRLRAIETPPFIHTMSFVQPVGLASGNNACDGRRAPASGHTKRGGALRCGRETLCDGADSAASDLLGWVRPPEGRAGRIRQVAAAVL